VGGEWDLGKAQVLLQKKPSKKAARHLHQPKLQAEQAAVQSGHSDTLSTPYQPPIKPLSNPYQTPINTPEHQPS